MYTVIIRPSLMPEHPDAQVVYAMKNGVCNEYGRGFTTSEAVAQLINKMLGEQPPSAVKE